MLKGGIEHHVAEEETEILPDLKDAKDRDEWLALGDRLADAKRVAGLPVPQPRQRRSTTRTQSRGTTKASSKASSRTSSKATSKASESKASK